MNWQYIFYLLITYKYSLKLKEFFVASAIEMLDVTPRGNEVSLYLAQVEPIDPSKAVELHLAQKAEDASAIKAQAHDYHLRHFLRWCE